MNIKPTAYQEQKVGGSKIVTFSNITSVGSSGIEEKIIILKIPITGEIAPSTPNFRLKLLKIDLGSPSEVYLSKDSQESN